MNDATEELRRLLDERGVEWAVPDESWNQDSITYWKVGSIKWVAFESENGTLWLNCNSVTDLTTEQAIAATLGPREQPPHDQLQAENEKLRNVAGVMVYCMQAERDCDGCRMNGAAGTIAEPAGCDGLLDLLRELGVVADG